MANAVGAQGVDLSQSMLFQGYDPSILEREGYIFEASLNYPWLIAMSSQMGNAYTTGLAYTANAWVEPEWGWPGGGGNQNWQGAGGHGAIGGSIIAW